MALREQGATCSQTNVGSRKPPITTIGGPARPPLAVGGAVDRLPVPELAHRDARIGRRGVVDHRGERQRNDEAEQRVEDPPNHSHAPTLETAPGVRSVTTGAGAVDGFRRQVAAWLCRSDQAAVSRDPETGSDPGRVRQGQCLRRRKARGGARRRRRAVDLHLHAMSSRRWPAAATRAPQFLSRAVIGLWATPGGGSCQIRMNLVGGFEGLESGSAEAESGSGPFGAEPRSDALAEQLAAVFLQEVARALDRRSSSAFGSSSAITSAARREKIGSWSPKRTSVGRSNSRRRSRTTSIAGPDGWSELVATSSGNCTIPIRDSGTGNGAS